jgi:sulfatase maturation enzyme AslB (radical SAM superfamily)
VPESDGFITASVAFGNTCNLKCITCNPVSSSRWRSEYTSIYLKDVAHYNFYKQNFVTDFAAAAPNLIHIDIPGGEPFLSGVPEQKQLLRYYVDSGQAASITLHYTTNATVWPDPDWWELWSHFKEIDMQLSIDGVGARYEYIRYPAVWSVLVDTVQAYLDKQSLPNFRLSVSHTVSAYNILYLDEFFTWCYNIKLPKPWAGRVHTPVHMRPSVWKDRARNIIIEKLQQSQHADVVTWSQLIANTNDSEHFDQFCNRLQQHDQYRGTDFKTTFPELANYI